MLDLGEDPHATPGQQIAAELVIGKGTHTNEFNNIRAPGGTILIGDDCLVAQLVSIIASNHSIDNVELMRQASWQCHKNQVEIGDDVWIGANAVVLPGVTIGRGSVVAAGSVVTHNLPEYTIVAGVHATVRSQRARVDIQQLG